MSQISLWRFTVFVANTNYYLVMKVMFADILNQYYKLEWVGVSPCRVEFIFLIWHQRHIYIHCTVQYYWQEIMAKGEKMVG